MISQEDFKNGIYKYKGLEKKGTYKIFFEPLLSARVNDVGMFISLRDAIRYNEYHTTNTSSYYEGKIVDWLNLMFEYLANKAYLQKDEKDALNMLANKYPRESENGVSYMVSYDNSTDAKKQHARGR
jgi:hypothetical protein